MSLEYATMEWLWDSSSIRVNLPGGEEKMISGSYKEVVETLTEMGKDNWEVASCVASNNWLFWTLKRNNTTGARI